MTEEQELDLQIKIEELLDAKKNGTLKRVPTRDPRPGDPNEAPMLVVRKKLSANHGNGAVVDRRNKNRLRTIVAGIYLL